MSKNLSGNPARAAQQRADAAAAREEAARNPGKPRSKSTNTTRGKTTGTTPPKTTRTTRAKQRLQAVKAKLNEPAAPPPAVYDRATDPRFGPGKQTIRAGMACLFTGGIILVVCVALLAYSLVQLSGGGDPTTNGFARAAALAGGGFGLLLVVTGIISVVIGKRRARTVS
ncbi:hypothetical protein [Granulicoccus phenolivorans]|uniref:hypothetical protein n=1 Tax=Granulicoccus phenolivorans TaxID=266854 RepID=UPI000412AD8D|nr:hypothetical protein [Granulicoccus phenolivorans]